MPPKAKSAVIVLSALLIGAAAGDPTYLAQIQKWRQDFDADVRDGGWLTLVNRVKVDEGAMTVGSDRAAAVQLPEKAPLRLGVITRRGQRFEFTPEAESRCSIDGQPAVGPTELSTKPGTGELRAGDLDLHVRPVGDDFYLFVADPKAAAIREFKGNTWFPTNPAYRITAHFIAYAHPESVPLPLTHVESKEHFPSTGEVTFRLQGKSVRMKTYIDDGELFLMFQDGTNGTETYGGGRFLHAPLPKDGSTVLDFNKAFNPYCSVNTYVMCPVPPPGSRLEARVTAGEMFDGAH